MCTQPTAVFINEMATEVTARGDGWLVGEREISLLMFADDVVLIAIGEGFAAEF